MSRITVLDEDVVAGLYCRVSIEDYDKKDHHIKSGSIETQEIMLKDMCKKNKYKIGGIYIDDGFSGTTMNRPQFQKMVEDACAGKINTIICKDLSRLGRTYEVEMYLEKVFPENKIRFISVAEDIDSNKGDYSMLVAIVNAINSQIPKIASFKTKNAKEGRAKDGKFIGSKAPFGYKKDPNIKNHLIIDEEAAPIVQKIFDLALQGAGYNAIAKWLRENNIPTPAEYAMKHGNVICSRKSTKPEMECCWHVTSVQSILMNPVYCGDCAQGRRGNDIIKGKQHKREKKDWIVVKDTHDAIIAREDWNAVQEQIGIRRRACADGTPQMFAGLLYCADCNSALSFSKIERKTMADTGKYRCWFALRHGRGHCTPHTIYLHNLVDAVLNDIREIARMALQDKEKLIELLMKEKQRKYMAANKAAKKAYDRAINRCEELRFFEKGIVEKNLKGQIDDDQYSYFMESYKQERKKLTEEIEAFEDSQNEMLEDDMDPEKFADVISKYSDIKELNASILNALIEKILVHEKTVAEDGTKIQEIEIFYRFAGKVPDAEKEE